MNARSFIFLAGAAVVAVVAAATAAFIQARITGDVQLYDEPMFPRLVERANDAAKIVYRTGADSAVIELKDGVWRFVEKEGYPVQAGNVRAVVASVAALRKLEPKTDRPARYTSLAVEDVTAPNVRSRELIIEDASGQRLAAVIMGRTSSTMQFDPLGGIYVRVPGEARSWLVRGTVALPPTAVDWMERQIVHIPGPEVKTLQIHEGGQLVLNTEKETDAMGVVRYQLVPRDEKNQAADSAVKQVASAVVSLTFDDVKPAAKFELPGGGRELVFMTFDGLKLSAELADVDGKTWARFKASAEPGSASAAKAQAITAATDGWVFQLPGFKLPAFTRSLAELIEPKPTPGAAGAPAPLPPGFGLPGRLVPPGVVMPGAALPVPGRGAQPVPPAPQP